MDDELPPGWAWATLGDVVLPPRGKIPPDTQSSLPFLGLEHIPANSMRPIGFGEFADMRSAASQFLPGDVLYGRLRPYLNKVWKADRQGAASAEFIVFPKRSDFDSDFLAFLLHGGNFVGFAKHAVSGDRPRIDVSEMAPFRFPVPPRLEQTRIAAEVSRLFAELDEAEAALARAREGVEQFRASLLHAACTGALTASWREANPPTETGADLPALPETWRWCKLVNLISDGPTNGLSPPTSSDERGSIGLKLTATTGGTFDLSKHCLKRLSVKVAPGSKFFLSDGDLVFQRGNTREYVGMAAIYRGPPDTYVFPDLMIRVRMADNKLAEWVWRYANSPLGRHYFQETASGTAGSMPKINGRVLREMPIAIPPPEERVHILRILDALIADHTDARRALEEVGAQNARLRQSILHAAFTGRLVPQDPTDEPASALMARLRASDAAPSRRPRLTRRV